MPRLLRPLLAVALAALSAMPATPAAASDGCYYRENEKRVMSSLNGRRASNGKAKLRWDLDLARVARHHTYKMANSGSIYHNLSHNGTHVTNWSKLGEIIGKVSNKSTDAKSVTAIVNAFMGSGTHRSIVLGSDWKYFGAGVVRGKRYLWVTVLFEASGNPGTNLHRC